MDMKSILRTGVILLFMLGRTSVANADSSANNYVEPDFDVQQKYSLKSQKFFQKSLSGLYNVPSWQADSIQQPYSDFATLYQNAELAQHELSVMMHEIALASNAHPIIPTVKSEQRAKVKIAQELNGQVDRITDLSRATLIADDIPSLMQAFELLNKEARIVAVKNRFKNPAPSGYRDLKVLVELPKTQLIAEVQLHLDEIATIKNGEEHKIYEQIQKIERTAQTEARPFNDIEQTKIKKLRSISQQMYQDAWQQYLQPTTNVG
ncbi:phosphoribosylglycinamide formyltransferase [Photobacterium damselae]|uniref:phosphoribosylglycinamide formyltransferase n=1 Tax=Photobacterium damselae TaxID=38293 RepID=UPI002543CAA1|nr:phosphoribosylglycinamide formyltransferase [Photobacterium damselae]WIH21426.1 phosphoribosylglycinamide formyltransferase [Photobacterium damselae]